MILVTGGTGMIGTHVLLACAKDKLDTLALYRWKSSIDKVADFFKLMAPKNPEYFNSIQWHQSDLNDLVQLEKIFPNVTEAKSSSNTNGIIPARALSVSRQTRLRQLL